jgi:hypothetical protein
MDISHRRRRIVSFDRYNPHDLCEISPLGQLRLPDGIEMFGEELHVADIMRGVLFTYNFIQKRFIPLINLGPLPNSPRRCVEVDNDLFISAGNTILKISSGRQETLVADLTEIIGTENVRPLDLAVLKQGNDRILFVSDVSLPACIHKFVV